MLNFHKSQFKLTFSPRERLEMNGDVESFWLYIRLEVYLSFSTRTCLLKCFPVAVGR